VLKQHKWEGYVRSVAFDPEGTFVAAVQADGCLLVMDWAANKVVKKHVAPRVGARLAGQCWRAGAHLG
jgi:hypothetical protein